MLTVSKRQEKVFKLKVNIMICTMILLILLLGLDG